MDMKKDFVHNISPNYIINFINPVSPNFNAGSAISLCTWFSSSPVFEVKVDMGLTQTERAVANRKISIVLGSFFFLIREVMNWSMYSL